MAHIIYHDSKPAHSSEVQPTDKQGQFSFCSRCVGWYKPVSTVTAENSFTGSSELKQLSNRELADLLQAAHVELDRRLAESLQIERHVHDYITVVKRVNDLLDRFANKVA